MRFGTITRWKLAAAAAGVAALAILPAPARAGSTTIDDASGVDYDAACLHDGSPSVGGPNRYSSPGGACSLSTSDGSHEGIDLNGSLSLASNSPGQITASWTVDGSVPPAGNTNRVSYDLPDRNFVGGTYFALFQNKTIQTNNTYTACPQIPPRPTPVLQRFGTWHDGFHFFVALSVSWDGTKWIHSAQLGEYAPDGGFGFFELGTNDGNGWVAANPTYHPYDDGVAPFHPYEWRVDFNATLTGATVTAPGVYKSPDTTNCLNGHFDYWFAKPGDVIANAKGLTTANQVVTLPVTIPASTTCSATSLGQPDPVPDPLVCEPDITSVGGFVFWGDTTAGNSTAGAANTNITGIALTAGLIGGVDTLGPGPSCPTPTVGGLLPQNPSFTPNQACHIDDDATSRGSLFQEYWDTVHGFIF